MPATGRLSLWAMPAADDGDVYREWIERLAHAADTCSFEPHLTLVGSITTEPPRARIARIVVGTARFAVDLVEVADNPERFRCVVLVARAGSPIVTLHNQLAAVCAVDAAPYWPHLSLLYAELDAVERERQRRSVTIPLPTRVAIDSVALVDTSDADVTRWSVIDRWPMLPSASDGLRGRSPTSEAH